MGRDKAAIVVGNETLAHRTARILSGIADPCLEVGPGASGLPVVSEPLAGEGPLTALAAGWVALEGLGYSGPVLVVATDLARLSVEVLRWLAGRPEDGSVVPVIGGRPQPLCARWCEADLRRAVALAATGERRLQVALGADLALLGAEEFPAGVAEAEFLDCDTPEDLAGLS